MMVILYWIAGAALLASGWLASAWFYKRKIDFLNVQMRVMRQTATAHADQARRQIGQLQAELSMRPALVRNPPDADEAADTAYRRKPAVPDKFVVLEDGFAQTAITGDGFAPTQLMR
jgi:hypothetical protein